MKFEFLGEARDPGPLIRLYGYESDEVNLLRLACLELADGRTTQFALHEQPWCKAIGGCQLIWQVSATDVGIRFAPPGEPLVLQYSKEAWLEVEEKLRPFCERSSGFNWLTDEGDVDLLISWGGGW